MNMTLCVLRTVRKTKVSRYEHVSHLESEINAEQRPQSWLRVRENFHLRLIPNERDANIDSKITIGNPTEIADSRNRNGRIGVCHSGCIFGPAITISVPSDDWCSVESTTPAMMKTNITLESPRSSPRRAWSTSRRPGTGAAGPRGR